MVADHQGGRDQGLLGAATQALTCGAETQTLVTDLTYTTAARGPGRCSLVCGSPRGSDKTQCFGAASGHQYHFNITTSDVRYCSRAAPQRYVPVSQIGHERVAEGSDRTADVAPVLLYRSRPTLGRAGSRRSGRPEPRKLLTQRNQTVQGDDHPSHLRSRLTFGQTNYLDRSVTHLESTTGS
jgi:hypothetical protein